MPACRFTHVTSGRPGAIGVIQLDGDVTPILQMVTGRDDWTVGRVRLARLGDVDDGLVALVAPELAQLMPHGGPRVMQRLRNLLIEVGAVPAGMQSISVQALFPEASDRVEALMLRTLARAASPLAIELLLDQPRRWRARPSVDDDDRRRSRRLDRMVEPATVVLAGPPNVGKSTLSNVLLGRSMSIAVDEPGTTRDYTVGRIDLGGLVVHWHDTPGLRSTDDAIETDAITLAARLLERADLIVAMTDASHDWPALPRSADLRIASRCDRSRREDADLQVSAVTGEGLESLVVAVRDRLVPPNDRAHPGPWLFDPDLEDPADSDRD
ncbi:MAG: GTPase [Planctomycetota bacterium]|jgi:tRNA U34 5-carboxymethylaminomethyl modifying GTPase MnmE/TrmE